MDENGIEIEHLHKSFRSGPNERTVIKDLSISVRPHEIVCILGYTGCGKTTLLRLVAGLESPDSGRILLGGRPHNAPDRHALMVFQDYNQIFPWKTALGNVSFSVRRIQRRCSRKEVDEISLQALREVGLESFAGYYPHQMSGGMRQRVSVARALVLQPAVLLMDEPFAALDEITRRKLQEMCREVFKRRKVTVLFVTHSVDEALSVGDRILVMTPTGGDICADMQCPPQADTDIRIRMRQELIELLTALEKK